MDALRQIQTFNAGRDAERLLLKYRAMRTSPFQVHNDAAAYNAGWDRGEFGA